MKSFIIAICLSFIFIIGYQENIVAQNGFRYGITLGATINGLPANTYTTDYNTPSATEQTITTEKHYFSPIVGAFAQYHFLKHFYVETNIGYKYFSTFYNERKAFTYTYIGEFPDNVEKGIVTNQRYATVHCLETPLILGWKMPFKNYTPSLYIGYKLGWHLGGNGRIVNVIQNEKSVSYGLETLFDSNVSENEYVITPLRQTLGKPLILNTYNTILLGTSFPLTKQLAIAATFELGSTFYMVKKSTMINYKDYPIVDCGIGLPPSIAINSTNINITLNYRF